MNYSQNDEEFYILKHAPPRGMVLDIGAFDGYTRSNSRELIERGYGGVLVEPAPAPFCRLLSLYEDNPRVLLVHAAVADDLIDRKMSRMWLNDGELSTTDKRFFDRWREAAVFYRPAFVGTINVQDLLGVPGARTADVISIDTEGTSEYIFAILKSMVSPKVFCVESTECRADTIASVRNRYECVYESAENIVLVRKD